MLSVVDSKVERGTIPPTLPTPITMHPVLRHPQLLGQEGASAFGVGLPL